MATLEATNATLVLSVVERQIPDLPFLRPLHIGDATCGHYVLLSVCPRDGFTIIDSLPSFRPGASIAAARAFLRKPRAEISIVAAPAQGPNECAFAVVNEARRLLGAPFILRPAPGALRKRYVPDLIAFYSAELAEATAEVVAHESTPAPQRHTFNEAQSLHDSPACSPVVLPPPYHFGHHYSDEATDTLAFLAQLHDEQRPAIIAHATPALPAMADSEFESILKTLTIGQRIRCDFRERTDIDGTSHDILSWTGNVTKPWNRSRRCVEVLWDSGLPCFSGRRRAALPEADLPDPLWEYIALTADFAPDTPSQQIPASLPAASPALRASALAPQKVQPCTTTPESADAPQPPPAPRPREWWLTPHSRVQSLMRTTAGKANQWLRMTVKRDGGTEQLTVVGHVVTDAHGTVLRVARILCTACGGWSEPEDVLVIPAPVPHCTYFSAEVITTLTDVTCSCDDVDTGDGGITTAAFKAELAPDASLGWCTQDSLRGDTCCRWYIHTSKPAHVHTLTWRALADTTRSTHIRWLQLLKQMPREYHNASLGAAAIQIVLLEAARKQWTSWATVATALSSVASALRHLPEYTANRHSIDLLKVDSQFATSCKRAQHLARITKRHSDKEAMTPQQYSEALGTCKIPAVRLLLILCWIFAARAGDMRQIQSQDVKFASPVDGTSPEAGRRMLSITFRSGKGAAFWGPFTVAAYIDDNTAKSLADHIRLRKANDTLFTETEQRSLASIVRDTGAHDVRAIRRGRLQHLAACGASNEELRLLSGHKRVDTLLRYLGWGLYSSSAAVAALAREQAEIQAAAVTGGEAPCPTKMGPFSGYCGQVGRRVQRPPNIFHAPKHKELGLTPSNTADWPLKAKDIATLDWDTIRHMLEDKEPVCGNYLLSATELAALQNKVNTCRHWCSAGPMLESSEQRPPHARTNIPIQKISRRDFNTITASNKLNTLREDEEILGWAAAYLIPQPKKEQRRPVFEPALNRWNLADQPQTTYPARRVRRYLRAHPYIVDFDFTQFFDQFPLAPEAQAFYCVRYRVVDGDTSTEHIMKLTRLPMGVTFAPAVAQYITDVLIAPIMKIAGCKAFSMIDNVRIAARDARTLQQAVSMFLARCHKAKVIINPAEDVAGHPIRTDVHQMTLDELTSWALTPKVFLGELTDTTSNTCRNAPKNTLKLIQAWQRMNNLPDHPSRHPPTDITLRHGCALLSLILWMIHTHDIHLSECADVLRTYSRLAQRAHRDGYDTPMTHLDNRIRNMLQSYVQRIVTLDETGSPLPVEPSEPSCSDTDYDVIINSDSCEGGWAAYVRHGEHLTLLRQRWRPHSRTRFDLSTVSEPVALTRALTWVQTQPWYHKGLRIACITDHAAIVSGQERWWSSNGGFSANPYLNTCYLTMHQTGAAAFFIPGEDNPADGPSRSPTLGNGDQLHATSAHGQASPAPPLALLEHPFINRHEGSKFLSSEAPRMMG
ncbi:TATE DNA transposon, putative [Bodo saltans]|uniref:TATE DNA transposon, putative n=1 Tax=Bodo saltans TaxID=75058 RepID=A0A0S4IT03_BODSA|nr:TATE DNA transposon, putative [Bodo saltans]|eukprot:CUF10151.1 TATE DNA transposon, putative [Bodo saltans]